MIHFRKVFDRRQADKYIFVLKIYHFIHNYLTLIPSMKMICVIMSKFMIFFFKDSIITIIFIFDHAKAFAD